MTAVHRAGTTGPRLPAAQLPRLVAAGAPLGLQAHLSRYGPLPPPARSPAARTRRAGRTGQPGRTVRPG